MNFTEKQLKRIRYFSKSVRLDNPRTAQDPAYQFSDEDLWSILEYSAPMHRGLSIDDTDDSEFYMVLLLAKREIYYRLATTTAPFYRIEADDSRIEKNMRFDHYMKLVEAVTKEYDDTYELKYGKDGNFGDETGTNGVVTVYNAQLHKKTYLRRYNQLNRAKDVNLLLSSITQTSVNLDWDRFSSNDGADFDSYEIYVSEDMIYDEYSYEEKPIKSKPIYVIRDVRRTKVRINDLEPNKVYHVLIRFVSYLGNDSIQQEVFRTLPNPDSPDIKIEMGSSNE